MGAGEGCLSVIGWNLTLHKVMYPCWVNLYFLQVTEKERLEGVRKIIKLNIVKISIKREFKRKGLFFPF